MNYKKPKDAVSFHVTEICGRVFSGRATGVMASCRGNAAIQIGLLACALLPMLCGSAAAQEVVEVERNRFQSARSVVTGSYTINVWNGVTYTFEGAGLLGTDRGGALYANGGSVLLTIGPKDGGTGRTVFVGNRGRVGGAISVEGGARAFLTNVRFGALANLTSGNSTLSESGGAIYLGGSGTVSITNGEFYRNLSTREGNAGGFGGGIHLASSGVLIVRDSTFGSLSYSGTWNPYGGGDPFAAGFDRGTGNWAVSGDGGAINLQNAGARAEIYNTKFYYNVATRNTIGANGNGGAVKIMGTALIKDSVFFGNRTYMTPAATNDIGGGAISITAGSTVNLIDTDFDNNISSSYGGAILNRGTLNIVATRDMNYEGNYSGTSVAAAVGARGGFLFMRGENNAVANINIATGATLAIGSAAYAGADTIAASGTTAVLNIYSGTNGDAGTLVLHGNNTAFNAVMNVHGGRVLLGNASAALAGTTAASKISVKSGGVFGGWGTSRNVFVDNGGTIQIGLDGVFGATFGVSGTLAMANGSRFTGNGTLRNTVDDGGNPNSSIILGSAAGDWVTAEVQSGAQILVSASNAISGAGGLVKTGEGTLQMDAAANYSGGTRIEGGSIVLGAQGALGAGQLGVTGSSATLAFTTGRTFANAIDISGGLNISSQGNSTLSGAITGGGSLFKLGADDIILGNASAFTGTIGIRAGRLSGNINNTSAVLLYDTTYAGDLDRSGGRLLAGSGTITGALAVTGGKLSFDLRNSDGVAAYDSLSVGGAFSSGAGSVINLSNIGTSSTYTLVTAGNVGGLDTSHFIFTVDGHAQTNRTDARLYKDAALSTLSVAAGVRNLRMTWAGGDAGAPALWDAHAANWSETSGEKNFRDGDSVVFGAATSGSVTVASAGATVGDMLVDAGAGQAYTFAGGRITGTNALSDSDRHTAGADNSVYLGSGSTAAVTSKLVKSGEGTLVFANDGNHFAGGIELRSGTVAFSDGDQLGGAGINVTNNAALRVDANTALAANVSVAADKIATLDTQDNALEFSGSLASAASSKIAKTGSGDLWINAVNHSGHHGATEVREGRLLLGAGANLGDGAVTVLQGAVFGGHGTARNVTLLGGAALQVGAPEALVAEQLNITAALTLNAGAQLNFSILSGNANPLGSVNSSLNAGSVNIAGGASSAVTIDLDKLVNGVYNLGNVSALAGAKITYFGQDLGERQKITYESTAASGTLLIKIDMPDNEVMQWTGAIDGSWNINTRNWRIAASGSSYSFGDGDKLVFDGVADAAHPENRAITIAGRRMTLSDMVVTGTADYTFLGGAEIITDAASATPNISGSAQGKLHKEGAGTLTFENAANQFNGGIEVTGGAVAFTKAAQLNTNGAGIMLDSGTLRAAGDFIVLSEAINIGAGKSGAFDTAGYAVRYTGTFAAAASGTFVKTGSGAFEMLGDNSAYGGSIQVAGGELLLRNDAFALTRLGGAINVDDGGVFGGQGEVTGTVTVGRGGMLRIGAPVTGSEQLTVADLRMGDGSGILGGGVLAGNMTIGFAAGDLVTLANVISKPVTITATTAGDGTLVKAGAGLLTLSGTAPLGHSQTRIEGGIVYIRDIDPSAISSVVHAFDLAGGWLDLADVRDFGDVPYDQWANLTFTGSAGGVIGYGDEIRLGAGDVGFEIGGSGTGRGVFVVVDAGTGTATLSGSSNYVGYTRVDSGVLSVSHDNNLGNTDAAIADPRDVILNGGALLVTGNLTTTRRIELRESGTVFVNGGISTSWTDVSGTGAFTKDGDGTLILSRGIEGESYHTGAKTVNGGVLQGRANVLNGVIVNNATVALNAESDDTKTGVFTGTIIGGAFSKVGDGTADIAQSAVFSNIKAFNVDEGVLTSTGGPLTLAASTAVNVGNRGEFWFPKGGSLTAPLVTNVGMIRVGFGAGSLNPIETLTINGNYHGGDAQTPGNLMLGLGKAVNGQVLEADIFHVKGVASGTTFVSFTQPQGAEADNLANFADSLPLNVVRVDGGGGDFVQSGRVTYGVKDYNLVYDPSNGTSHWKISLASEIPAIIAVDAAIMLANHASFDGLSQRLGSMGLIDGYVGRQGFDVWANGIYRRDRFSGTIYSGARADTSGMQAGIDYTDANRTFALGVFIDRISSDTRMPYATDTDSTTDGFGAYITYRPEKWYFNLLIRVSEGTYEVNIPQTPTVETDTGSAGISVAIGRHYEFENGITLVPEIQAAWTRTNVDNTKDRMPVDGTGINFYGRAYRIDPIQSTTARASLMASKLYRTGKKWEMRPYARIGFAYEFDGETNMSVQTIGELIRYKNELGGAWGTLSAGSSVRMGDRWDLWADLAWNYAGKIDGFSVNVGSSYRF